MRVNVKNLYNYLDPPVVTEKEKCLVYMKYWQFRRSNFILHARKLCPCVVWLCLYRPYVLLCDVQSGPKVFEQIKGVIKKDNNM